MFLVRNLVVVSIVQGLVLIPAAQKQFETDGNPFGFMFAVADIQEIRPIVRVSETLLCGG